MHGRPTLFRLSYPGDYSGLISYEMKYRKALENILVYSYRPMTSEIQMIISFVNFSNDLFRKIISVHKFTIKFSAD